MRYSDIRPARFLDRPNRFIAHCQIGGEIITAHVKNTGRCRELLIPGAQVYLSFSRKPDRRTPCDLIAVQKGDRLVNMDSQAPNQAFEEGLKTGRILLPGQPGPLGLIQREKVFGASRFDFFVSAEGIEKKPWQAFIEVKGVTLEEDGVVLFPDAPTERGIKHLKELVKAKADGYEAFVAFVVQMKDVSYFMPNVLRHAAFAQTLREASAAGVGVMAYDCLVTPDRIEIEKPVAVRLPVS
jgi:sugar fermentation stimulation protein A